MNAIEDTRKNSQVSILSIYDKVLKEREEKEQTKRHEKESKKAERLAEAEIKESGDEEDRPLSKKEKRERSLDQWRDVIYNLTGDDLEYIAPKKKKNKYKKWIDDDENVVGLTSEKPKKKKKTNFNKEFEHELNMLKSIVTEQNRFTDNLHKRFQNMVGPVNKDSMPLNKTQVELAAVINSSRTNSLSMLREITNIKKAKAELYMKQKKMDSEGGSSGYEADLGLQGANMMQRILASEGTGFGIPQSQYQSQTATTSTDQSVQYSNVPIPKAYEDYFDPAGYSFEDSLVDPSTKYENTPKKTIVEFNQDSNTYKYRTYNSDSGEEISDYPNPTFDIKSMDPENKLAKDEFGTIYDLKIV